MIYAKKNLDTKLATGYFYADNEQYAKWYIRQP